MNWINGSLKEVYDNFWNPSLYVLNDIERRGIKLDVNLCKEAELNAREDQLVQMANLENWAGYDSDHNPIITNWNSNSEISAFLYETKAWPIPPVCGSRNAVKINFEKKPTVDYGAIDYHRTHLESALDRRACECLLEYRQARDDGIRLSKLPGHLGSDGRLHSVLKPSTDTGRLSSSNPALQQICSADRDKYGIRKAFIPKPGHLFIVADYSQLELYILAYYLWELFRDERLYNALKSGDIHSYVAKLCWTEIANIEGNLKDHPDPKVQKKRKDVKSVIYGMNYGKSDSGLGAAITDENGIAIGRARAKELKDLVMAATGAGRFQEYIINKTRELRGVYSIFGRWRPLPEISSSEWGLKKSAERKALNSPIQMSAADIVTLAMLRLSTLKLRTLQERNYYNEDLFLLSCSMVLQVHDELVFEVPEKNATQAAGIIKEVMENVHEMPLVANVSIAENWYEGK